MKGVLDKSPVNKTAALVTSKGTSYEPEIKIQTADQDTPIPTRSIQAGEDLTGRRRGRFTVMGLALRVNGRWVVRCDCGVYTLRKAKAIKNEANEEDRCERCRAMAQIKRKYEYRKTGKDVDLDQF